MEKENTDSSDKLPNPTKTPRPKQVGKAEKADKNPDNKNKKRNDPGPCPWGNQVIHFVNSPKQCEAVVNEIKLHCKQYNVLGFSCTVPEYGNQKTALLQLTTHRGLCALFHLATMRNIPKQLKNLLEDDNIIKVSADATDVALKLTPYFVYTSKILDLRYLSPWNQFRKFSALSDLSAKYLDINLRLNVLMKDSTWKHRKPNADMVNYTARVGRVTIELFKKFEKMERGNVDSDTTETAPATRKDVQKYINEKCKSYLNKPYRIEKEDAVQHPKPHAVMSNRNVHLVDSTEKCLEITKQIQEHCQQVKVLGLCCQFSSTNKVVTLLQLSTHRGLCALIQLNRIKSIPAELLTILSDENIMKVGVNIYRDSDRLVLDYDIHVVNILDLRYLARKCQQGLHDLHRLAEAFLKVETRPDDWRLTVADWTSSFRTKHEIRHAADLVHVMIELYKTLEKKLLDETYSGDRTKLFDELCAPNFNDDFPSKKKANDKIEWTTLPEQEICVVSTVEECKAAVEQLQKHCDEYNVLGFDCEWVPTGRHKVGLLQLATHRGLCALIRLCKLESIPDELKQLMKNTKILKVGVMSQKDAKMIFTDYRIDVKSILDLKKLSTKCKFQAQGLAGLAEEVLHVKMQHKRCGRIVNKLHGKWEDAKLDEINIKYAANDAHVAIELFKTFQTILMPDNPPNDAHQFIDKHCLTYLHHK